MIIRKLKSTEQQDENSFKVRITVNIGSRIIDQDLEESLSIPSCNSLSPSMIQQILSENPVLHARWNVLYNEAVYDYDIKKSKSEVWLAKKSQEYRKELEQLKKGRVTDKMVDDMIKTDSQYETIFDDLAQAKKNMKNIYVFANGFGEKGDKIISIASLMKWEAENLSGKKYAEKTYSHIQRDFEEEKPEKLDPKVNDGWPTT